MSDPQKYINRITNLVYLHALTYTLHQTALDEVKTGEDRPIHLVAGGDMDTAKLQAAWELAHEDVAATVRELQAQAWEDGFTEGASYYHESNKPPADFTETANTLNPYKKE